MTAPFEERYMDVLQNLESAIVRTYHEHPALTDRQVRDVIDALIRGYEVEARGRSLPAPRFSAMTQELYAHVQTMCDWRLGKEELVDDSGQPVEAGITPVTIPEIIACLKRIRLSIKMHKSAGPRGYLNFVSQFVA